MLSSSNTIATEFWNGISIAHRCRYETNTLRSSKQREICANECPYLASNILAGRILVGGTRQIAARLYRLALEKAEPNARYHAVAKEGVPLRDIVETIGRHLKLSVESITAEQAPDFFGWFAPFAGLDLPASSAQTRKKLCWEPVGPGLLVDLDQGHYAE